MGKSTPKRSRKELRYSTRFNRRSTGDDTGSETEDASLALTACAARHGSRQMAAHSPAQTAVHGRRPLTRVLLKAACPPGIDSRSRPSEEHGPDANRCPIFNKYRIDQFY